MQLTLNSYVLSGLEDLQVHPILKQCERPGEIYVSLKGRKFTTMPPTEPLSLKEALLWVTSQAPLRTPTRGASFTQALPRSKSYQLMAYFLEQSVEVVPGMWICDASQLEGAAFRDVQVRYWSLIRGLQYYRDGQLFVFRRLVDLPWYSGSPTEKLDRLAHCINHKGLCVVCQYDPDTCPVHQKYLEVLKDAEYQLGLHVTTPARLAWGEPSALGLIFKEWPV